MTDFLWGAATSSHQIEGNNVHNDWWQWEQEGNIEGGERSELACDHWNRFQQDLDLAAGLGLNSYRFSIEWSRLEPERGKWDSAAFDRYESLLEECEKRGLLPMVTLHHFTSPRWFTSVGGFTTEHAPGLFAEYVRQVVSRLGARVPLWCTLNEPNTLVVGQYLGSYMPPATFAPNLASLSCRNLLRAHVHAYEIIHGETPQREGRWKHLPLSVGIAHNLIDFVPLRAWHPVDQISARILQRFYNRSWLDAVTGKEQHFGATGLIPYAAQVSQARGRRTVDFIGINYYTRVYVGCRPYSVRGNSHFPANSAFPIGILFGKEGDVVSDLGWSVHPPGLGRMLRLVSGYDLPLYVTENGIADTKDFLRPCFLISHLKEIAKALTLGIDVRGYFHWSLLDNFEWVKGFGPRFGLFEVNYKTFERKERPSARLYRHIIERHFNESLRKPSSTALKSAYDFFPSEA